MNKDLQLREEINKRLERVRTKKMKDLYRLGFHLTPPVGLMNDPNGLVYFKGKYHVFFQWNPFDTKHTFKAWGHFSSEDFIQWEEHPPALVPSEWFERDGCYSGSALTHQGKLYLFYTGNVRTNNGGRESYQCLAVSEDGIHFEKKGPIIELPKGYTSDFRDPKVWREKDRWYLVVGAQTESLEGTVVLYSSLDLLQWKLEGPLAGPGISMSNKFGYMWECPDFFSLDGKDVLIYSPQGLEAQQYQFQNLYQSGYIIGNWNRQTKRFEHGKFQELDYGFDFYAPQTFTDNKKRRILIAWMGMGDEQEQNHPTVQNGWLHALTIPRELRIIEGRIYQRPVNELKTLRRNHFEASFNMVHEQKEIAIHAQLQEIIIEINKFEGKELSLHLQGNWKLTYSKDQGVVIFERMRFDGSAKETRKCLVETVKHIHILQDLSSVEIFLNNGEKVFTSRFYPTSTCIRCLLSVDGNVALHWQSWDLDSFCFKC